MLGAVIRCLERELEALGSKPAKPLKKNWHEKIFISLFSLLLKIKIFICSGSDLLFVALWWSGVSAPSEKLRHSCKARTSEQLIYLNYKAVLLCSRAGKIPENITFVPVCISMNFGDFSLLNPRNLSCPRPRSIPELWQGCIPVPPSSPRGISGIFPQTP